MKHVEITRSIDAPPEAIWRVITDAQLLASSDTGINRIEGNIAPGEKIKLWSEVSPGRAFALTVADFDVNRRMVWKGGMPLGLFTGVRTFNIHENAGTAELQIREEFSGPLSSMIWKSMPDLNPSFAKLADCIKSLAEERR